MSLAPEIHVLRISKQNRQPLDTRSHVNGAWSLVWKTNQEGRDSVSQVSPGQWGTYRLTSLEHPHVPLDKASMFFVVCPLRDQGGSGGLLL